MPCDKEATRLPALLCLPPHLRRRIYILGIDPPPARNFAGLLLACRALYTEAAALLYSTNRFVIFYSAEGSLGPLLALSPTSLASLTSLKVVLRESSCHQPVDSRNYPPYCCRGRHWYERAASSHYCVKFHGSVHRRPLLSPSSSQNLVSTDPAEHAMLAEWHDTALHLASRVGAGHLELLLVCDIDPEHPDALDTARLVVAPLALFPSLRDCHVRLSNPPNRALQRVAEDAVVRARPIARPLDLASAAAPSPLLSLPPELRHCILEYTDLITPWREVTWSRQDHGFQLYHPPCTLSEGGCPPYIHQGCPLHWCNPSADWPNLSPGCFCRRRHAAFSLACHCWAPPTNLFLICRLLCRDAEFVFFSGNRFVVFDYHPQCCWFLPPEVDPNSEAAGTTAAGNLGPYPYERFAASEFLRHFVPARCLAALRFLELVFPPYEPDTWPLDQHPAMLDWRATVDWIRCEGNTSALMIRLIMVVDDRRHQVMTRAQRRQVMEGYRRMLSPLNLLAKRGHLQRTFGELMYPLRHAPEAVRHRRRYGYGWRDEMVQEFHELFQDEPGEDNSASSRGSGSGTDEDDTGSVSLYDAAEPRESVWERWLDVW